MKAKIVRKNPNFVGRSYELERLKELGCAKESSILIVYGRRRVGKTELLEQCYRKRNILKFEGIEGASEEEQMQHVMWQFGEYVGEPIIGKYTPRSWTEVFKYIADKSSKGLWTIYFEEVQWLANYKDRFISELKYAWDNYYRYNEQLLLILCGSSPSFIINNVLKSRALYNRSQHVLHLMAFNPVDAKLLLKVRSNREVMDAYLTVGGIPEYLKRLNKKSSVFLSLCQEAFTSDGFFTKEHERIFTSSLADKAHYKKIVECLSRRRFANRGEILNHLKLKSSGKITEILVDLEICGFICKYTPYNLRDTSNIARYCVADFYLQFYYKFIEPIQKNILQGDYNNNPTGAIKSDTYYKWLGFSFERMCRTFHHVIAKILGFEAVHYKSGVFFDRASETSVPGYQIDLIYDRDDFVYTLCEIKYSRRPVTTKVINEFERKIELFQGKKKHTIHKVLITASGVDNALMQTGYFDRIITLDDLMDPRYWS